MTDTYNLDLRPPCWPVGEQCPKLRGRSASARRHQPCGTHWTVGWLALGRPRSRCTQRRRDTRATAARIAMACHTGDIRHSVRRRNAKRKAVQQSMVKVVVVDLGEWREHHFGHSLSARLIHRLRHRRRRSDQDHPGQTSKPGQAIARLRAARVAIFPPMLCPIANQHVGCRRITCSTNQATSAAVSTCASGGASPKPGISSATHSKRASNLWMTSDHSLLLDSRAWLPDSYPRRMSDIHPMIFCYQCAAASLGASPLCRIQAVSDEKYNVR